MYELNHPIQLACSPYQKLLKDHTTWLWHTDVNREITGMLYNTERVVQELSYIWHFIETVLKTSRIYCNGNQLPEYPQTEKYHFKDTAFLVEIL